MLSFLKCYKLNEKENNFDALRLILALIVFSSHMISYIKDEKINNILRQVIGFQGGADLAVFLFFSISGFLLTMSLIKSDNIANYIKKRFARIYPPIVVTVIIMLIDGLFFNKKPESALLTLSSILMFQDLLDSSFSIGHGAFWTLAVEFQFYLLLPFLLIFFKNNKICFFILLIALYIFGIKLASFFSYHLIEKKFINYAHNKSRV